MIILYYSNNGIKVKLVLVPPIVLLCTEFESYDKIEPRFKH